MFLFRMLLAPRPALRGLALTAAALLLAAVPATAQQGWPINGSNWSYHRGSSGSASYSPSFYSGGYGALQYSPSYAYGVPAYFAPSYAYGSSYSPEQTAGYYGADTAERPAVIDARVPADAVIRFDGKPTTSTGPERRFLSPPLKPGHDYSYEVQVQWKEGGRTVERRRTVEVRAGQRVNLDFVRPGE
jgi:uncharacterized protein (TIGR03000 family)